MENLIYGYHEIALLSTDQRFTNSGAADRG